MPTPKQLPAIKNEVDEETEFSFKFEGEEYTVALANIRDIDTVEELEEGKMVVPLKRIVGREQWKKFRANGDPDIVKMGEFAKALFEGAGVDLGE